MRKTGLAPLALVALAIALAAGCTAQRRPESIRSQAKQTTIDLAQDPDVQLAFARGRNDVMAQEETRRRIFSTLADEQRTMMADKDVERQFMALQIQFLRDTIADPQYRPQVVALVLDLLKDPKLQAELGGMIQAAVQKTLASRSGAGASGSRSGATPSPSGGSAGGSGGKTGGSTGTTGGQPSTGTGGAAEPVNGTTPASDGSGLPWMTGR